MSLKKVAKKASREAVKEGTLRSVAVKVAPDLIDFGIDAVFKAYDHRKQSPPETERPPVERRVYGAEAKSYEGQSDIDYCIECAIKHSQASSKSISEAIQRAMVDGPGSKGVQEKVREAVGELTGLELDTDTVKSEKVTALNTMARELRKFIYVTRAEIGKGSMDQLREIKGMVDELVDASYTVRAAEECPTCNVEEICGGDVECMQFLIEAAEKAGSGDEWEGFLKEARLRYGDRR